MVHLVRTTISVGSSECAIQLENDQCPMVEKYLGIDYNCSGSKLLRYCYIILDLHI